MIDHSSPLDKLGKLVFDLIALILFARLAWRLRKRRQTNVEEGS